MRIAVFLLLLVLAAMPCRADDLTVPQREVLGQAMDIAEAGDNREAARLVAMHIDEHPDAGAELHLALGGFLYDANQPEEALQAWLDGARIHPDDMRLWSNAGHVAVHTGRFANARDAARGLLAMEPDDGGHWRLLAWALSNLEEPAQAAGALEAARLADGGKADDLEVLAGLYRRAGAYSLAASRLEELHGPQPGAHAAETIAGLWLEAGRTRKAVAHLEQAARSQPTARRHERLAGLLLEIGSPEKSRQHAMEALEIDPESIAAWKLLGHASLALDDWKDAEEAFAGWLEREPKSGAARTALEQVRSLLNPGG